MLDGIRAELLSGSSFMPLTTKGEEIMSAMRSRYGSEKGEQVFYASKNAGKIPGVDRSDDNQHMGFVKGEAEPIDKIAGVAQDDDVKRFCDGVSKLMTRWDIFESRLPHRKPVDVKPRTKDNMQPSNVHPKELGG
jgi:hypothetical protein